MAEELVGEEVDEELAAIVEPLVAKVEKLTAEIEDERKFIAERRERINAKQGVRTRYLAIIRKIDPSKAPSLYKKNGKPKRQRGTTDIGVSQERLTEMIAWLQARKEEINAAGGIHASGIEQRNDFTIIPHQSGISKALGALHEQGIVTLDHRGTGGAKYFKVI